MNDTIKRWMLVTAALGCLAAYFLIAGMLDPHSQIRWGPLVGVPAHPKPGSVWNAPVPASAREVFRSSPESKADNGYRQVERVYITPMSHAQVAAFYATFEKRLADDGWRLSVDNSSAGYTSRVWTRPSENTLIEWAWTATQLYQRKSRYTYRDSSYETFTWTYHTYGKDGSADVLPANVGAVRWDGGWVADATAASWRARGNGILQLDYTGNVHRHPEFTAQP